MVDVGNARLISALSRFPHVLNHVRDGMDLKPHHGMLILELEGLHFPRLDRRL